MLHLNNLTGTDATALVTFGGVSAATFTTEAIIGDKISYEIVTSSTDTEIRITQFNYSSGDVLLWEEG